MHILESRFSVKRPLWQRSIPVLATHAKSAGFPVVHKKPVSIGCILDGIVQLIVQLLGYQGMTVPKGGRGKKEPYKSKAVRFPEELIEDFQVVAEKYRNLINTGNVNEIDRLKDAIRAVADDDDTN